MEKQPKLIVFDLDYTLWPFWIDTHVDPPFTKKSNGEVKDVRGQLVTFYPDVPNILAKLAAEGYQLAVASRTSCRREAEQLLNLFDWNKYFTYKQIYPGSKVTHFNHFHQKSGLSYTDMIFFDDEHRNIVDISKLGVHAVFAPNGVNWQLIKKGLKDFSRM